MITGKCKTSRIVHDLLPTLIASDSLQPDSGVQETYAAIDPTVLAAKKQKKFKAKNVNRKDKQTRQNSSSSLENHSNMPYQEEAYQVCTVDD